MRWDVFYALGAVLLGVGFVSALVGLDRLADNATFGCVVSFGLAVTILPVARFAARIGLLTQQ